MADLDSEKVKQIIANRPGDVSPEEVIQSLIDSGHKLLPPQAQPTALGFPVSNIPQSVLGVPTGPLAGMEVADVAAPIAAGGKKLADFLRSSAQQTEQIVGGRTGQALGIPARIGAGLIPETSGQVATQVALPLATAGLGAGAGAFAGTKLGQAAIGRVAQVGSGLTKVAQPIYEKVLKTPDILRRALPVDKAGDLMNNYFEQFGLKSGAKALGIVAEKRGLAAPQLGQFRKFTDKVVQKVKNESDTLAKIKAVEDDVRQKAGAKTQQLAADLVESEAKFGVNSPEVNVIRNQLHDIKNTVIKEGAMKLKELVKELPNPQDALAARQYLSKVTSKQAFQSVENKVVSPIAYESRDLLDGYLDKEIAGFIQSGRSFKPINVKGYGEIKTPDQIRQLFHEAKIGESFASPIPLTRAGQPDALRLVLGVLSKNPLALAQSPALHAQAIKLAQTLGQAGTGAKAALAGTALSKLGKKKEAK